MSVMPPLPNAGVRDSITPLQRGGQDAVPRRLGRAAGRYVRRWWRTEVASVPWLTLVAALLILVLGGWVTDALKGDELFTGVPWLGDHQWVVRVGLVLSLLVAAWRVFLKRRS